MNKKYTVKNKFGQTVYCILDPSKNLEEQLGKVLALHPGCGLGVDLYPTKIKVVDYFVGETVGEFEILSVEDTDEPTVYNWTEVK